MNTTMDSVQRNPSTVPEHARRMRWRLCGRWTMATAAGELASFIVPGLVGAVIFQAVGERPSALVAVGAVLAMAASGSVEGGVLGLAQWLVLRRELPAMPARAWIAATAAAAIVAWAIGTAIVVAVVPALRGDGAGQSAADPGAAFQIAAGAGLGLALGAMMGAAQWLVLRQHVMRAGWWVLASALGWAVGMAIAFLGGGALPAGASLVVIGLVIFASGTAMGAAVGAITGVTLALLLPNRPAPSLRDHVR